MGIAKLRKVARKMVIAACGSFSKTTSPPYPDPDLPTISVSSMKPNHISQKEEEEVPTQPTTNDSLTPKNLCTICLEALSYSNGNSPGQAIFTAQCSHAFHFACISSNVRHGRVTCPICRAHWTQLPRNVNLPPSCNQNDPVFRIIDDSIATLRVHRLSFLRSARYDDDDPIESDHTTSYYSRLDFSLMPAPPTLLTQPRRRRCTPSPFQSPRQRRSSPSSSSSVLPRPVDEQGLGGYSYRIAAYLLVKLTHPQATDLVLIANPNGPHLRLLKQAMSLVVFSLRPIDRLAIITYSSAAARVFPLRRMTSCGKRTALQVIDRLFYTGYADPVEGLKKSIKILEDRSHKNPETCILHLSDSPTRPYNNVNTQLSVSIHRFHVGFGFGASNGFVMHEFEEFLERVLGGVVKDIQLRIGEEGRFVRLGEMRGGEERRILAELGDGGDVKIWYSYLEGEWGTQTGDAIVSMGDKRVEMTTTSNDYETSVARSSTSSVASTLDYHDPYMARRWAKHLHGYRL